MTNRCSSCNIDYPHTLTQCLVDSCSEDLSFFSNVDPMPDWRERVDILNTPAVDFEDKVPRWRFTQLMAAGYAPRQAEELASRSHWEVDLHVATELAERAGPEAAYRILA